MKAERGSDADWMGKPLRILDFICNARMENMHGGLDGHGMYFKSRGSKKAHRDLAFRRDGGTVWFRLPALEEFGLISVAWGRA